MAKDDIDLDDLDMDDFYMDMDDYEEGDESKDDRNPVSTSIKEFGKSVGSNLVSKQSLMEISKGALPSSYGKAAGLIESAAESVDSIYRESAEELRKSTGAFKNIARGIDSTIGSTLPNIIRAQLKNFYESEESSYQWNPESHADTIANELKEVFNQEERREDVVLENAKLKQAQRTTDYSRLAAESLNRLVSYQDTVTIKYQQKSLELQYKQYYLQKTLVEASSEFFKTNIKLSKGIEKNTLLPEIQKIQKSELMAHTIRQRIADASINKVADYGGRMLSGLYENVRNFAGGAVGGITTGVDFYKEMRDSMEFLSPADRRAMEIQMMGGMVAENIRGWVGDKANDLYQSYAPGFLRTAMGKLGRYSNDPYAYINEWTKSSTTKGGLIGRGIDFAKSMIPTFGRDSQLSTLGYLDASGPVPFDLLTRKTITEIIPEYLSQIARWTKATYTGHDDGDMGRLVYDHITGTMTNRSSAIRATGNQVFSEYAKQNTRESVDAFIDELLDGEQVSVAARGMLRRQLLEDATNNIRFKIENYANPEHYVVKGTDEALWEIIDIIQLNHGIGVDGSRGNDLKSLERHNFLDEKFVDLKQNQVEVSTDRLQALADTYGKDHLYELGYVNRVDGRDMINWDRIWDEYLDGDKAQLNNRQVKGARRSSSSVVNNHRNIQVAGMDGSTQWLIQESVVVQENILEQLRHLTGDKPLSNIGSTTTSNDQNSWLGEESPMYRLTNRIADTLDASEHLLSNMFIMLNSKLIDKQPGAKATVLEWSRKGVTGASNLAGRYMRFWARQYRRIGGVAGSAISKLPAGVSGVAGALGSVATGILGIGDTDIYVRGREMPVLLGRDMEAGRYIDQATGNVIRSIKDITGVVIDGWSKDQSVVLTQAEFDTGLVDRKGKSLLGKALQLGNKYYNTVFKLYGKAGTGVASAVTGTMDWLSRKRTEVDLYIKDNMDKPVLMWEKLTRGEYFDEDGKVLRTWSDIKDRIYDENGNLIVSLRDIRAKGGLVNRFGTSLSKLGGGIRDLAGRAAGAYGRYVGAVMGGMGKIVRGIGRGLRGRGIFAGGRGAEFEEDLLYWNQRQSETQDQILKELRKLTAGMTGPSFDTTGDGLRDGSADAIRKERVERRKEEAERKRQEREERKARRERGGRDSEGGSGLLGGMASGIASKLKDWGGVAAGAVGGALWGGAKMLGGAALTAGKFIGKQVLWNGLRWAGAALVGTVGLPGLAIGAAVAGAGYLGYKLYKRVSRPDAKIHELRMAQYGFHYSDEKEVTAILEMERLLEPYVQLDLQSGTGKIQGPRDLLQQVVSLFGVKVGAEQPSEKEQNQIRRIMEWYQTRFQPVFLSHMVAKTNHVKGMDLHSIDQEIKARTALRYLADVSLSEMVDSGAFDNMTSPFGDGWIFDAKLTENSKDVSKFYKAATNHYSKLAKDEPADDTSSVAYDVDTSSSADASSGVAAATVGGAAGSMGKLKPLTQTEMGEGVQTAKKAGIGPMDLLRLATPLVIPLVLPKLITSTWNKLWGKDVSLLDMARYYTYGLTDDSKSKVAVLQKLEAKVVTMITWSGNGRAVFNGSVDEIADAFNGQFGNPSKSNGVKYFDWVDWFKNRFLPVLMATLTTIRKHKNIELDGAESKLTPSEILDVINTAADATYGSIGGESRSVWKFYRSPWSDGVHIGIDRGILDDIIAKFTNDDKEKVSVPNTNNPRERASTYRDANGVLTSTKRGDRNRTGWYSGNTQAGASGRQSATITNIDGTPYNGTTSYGTRVTNGTTSYGSNILLTKPLGGVVGDVPMPRGEGWDGSKDTILTASKAVGMDPSIMATIAGVESSFRPNARASTSSAKGYYQFVDKTWKDMVAKYGRKYGIPKGTSALDPRANALMGGEYIKSGYMEAKRVLGGKRTPTDVDIYLHHFLGPAGMKKFLAADPNTPVNRVVSSSQFNANKSIFMDGSRVRTVGEVYNLFDMRLQKQRDLHGLSPEGGITTSEEPVLPGSLEDIASRTSMGDGGTAVPRGGDPIGAVTGPTTVSSGTMDNVGFMGGLENSGGNRSNNAGATPTQPQMDIPKGGIQLILKREPSTDSGTKGMLYLPDGTRYTTLELGWRNNKPRQSCIPAGTYKAAIKKSGKFGTVYRLEGVPDRSEILIHAGNVAGNTAKGQKADSMGCILIGTGHGVVNGLPAVTNSRVGLEQFMAAMGNRPFVITIQDGGVEAKTMQEQTPVEPPVNTAPITRVPDYGSGVNDSYTPQVSDMPMGDNYDIVANTPRSTQDRAVQSAQRADIQAHAIQEMFTIGMGGTEALLRESNQIATEQLSVLKDIAAKITPSGDVLKEPLPAGSNPPSRRDLQRTAMATVSGINYSRNRRTGTA